MNERIYDWLGERIPLDYNNWHGKAVPKLDAEEVSVFFSNLGTTGHWDLAERPDPWERGTRWPDYEDADPWTALGKLLEARGANRSEIPSKAIEQGALL